MHIKPTSRILVIDDDEDIQLILKPYFEKFSTLTVHYAKNFMDAEEKIKHGNYDATLLDQNMQRWGTCFPYHADGCNLIPLIRNASTSRILGISDSVMGNQKLQRAGADECISKYEVPSILFIEEELMVA